MDLLKLAQLVVRVPNRAHVHAPSKNLPDIEMSNKEFLEKYADKSKTMPVSLDKDGVGNPQNITAYVVDIPDKVTGGYIPSEVIVNNGRGWLNELED